MKKIKVTVAEDGTGDYKTIQEALDSIIPNVDIDDVRIVGYKGIEINHFIKVEDVKLD